MNEASKAQLEQVTQLALREFQKALRENLDYKWEPRHGHPPSRGYIEQKQYSTEPWMAGRALRAWSITTDSVEPLPTIHGPPKDRNIDGMFNDLLVGFFGVTDDLARISINWQTGPRFGRGFVHSIERGPDGSRWLGRAQSTWMS